MLVAHSRAAQAHKIDEAHGVGAQKIPKENQVKSKRKSRAMRRSLPGNDASGNGARNHATLRP
jgi:hypothetical protein